MKLLVNLCAHDGIISHYAGVGTIVRRYVEVIRKILSEKNIISPKKSLNGDCILFFKKTQFPIYGQDGAEQVEEIEKNIVRQARFLVKQSGSLSTPELYDKGLMEILIQNGWLKTLSLKYKSLVDIFEKHLKWDTDTAKWIL